MCFRHDGSSGWQETDIVITVRRFSFMAGVKRRIFVNGMNPNLFQEVDYLKSKAFETEW